MWGILLAVCCVFSLCTAILAEPLRCNRPNEIAACVHPCPPERSCRNRGIQFSCHIEGECQEKCLCKEGYFRNPLGDCITGNECDMCPGDNEFFSCGRECDNVCSELHIQNRTSCPIVNAVCNRKCYCEDGFARDENKKCVPVEKCSANLNISDISPRVEREVNNEPLRCNRPNEIAACVHPCPPERTCRNKGILFSCVNKGKCQKKCLCKAGYFRNQLGDCITENDCDICTGRNEFFSCGSECDNVCSELHMQNRTNCPIVNVICNRKCYCEDGFARDENKKCIPVEKCSDLKISDISSRVEREVNSEPKCGRNEEYVSCKRTCPPETCISLVAKFKCNANEPCRPRCACKEGFLRPKTGEPCEPMRQCPEVAHSRF